MLLRELSAFANGGMDIWWHSILQVLGLILSLIVDSGDKE